MSVVCTLVSSWSCVEFVCVCVQFDCLCLCFKSVCMFRVCLVLSLSVCVYPVLLFVCLFQFLFVSHMSVCLYVCVSSRCVCPVRLSICPLELKGLKLLMLSEWQINNITNTSLHPFLPYGHMSIFFYFSSFSHIHICTCKDAIQCRPLAKSPLSYTSSEPISNTFTFLESLGQ